MLVWVCLFMSKCRIVGNLMSRLNFYFREHGNKYPLNPAMSNSEYLRYCFQYVEMRLNSALSNSDYLRYFFFPVCGNAVWKNCQGYVDYNISDINGKIIHNAD